MITALMLAAATATMQLHSGDFTDGGAMSSQLMSTDCGGANRSPSLDWTGAPAGTKSYAVIEHDPDAHVAGGFDHWVLYDIPATAHKWDGNAESGAAVTGTSSIGKAAYYGPCPPAGQTHHYVFTLYALDVAHVTAPTDALSAEQLKAAIAGHVLATATLRATAASP